MTCGSDCSCSDHKEDRFERVEAEKIAHQLRELIKENRKEVAWRIRLYRSDIRSIIIERLYDIVLSSEKELVDEVRIEVGLPAET